MNQSNHKVVDWFLSFWPQATLASRRDRLLGCIGAAIGLFGTEWLCRYTLGAANPWFIAPMGASAVLLFGVPASPLAQPWSIVGGNLVAALIGVVFASLLGTSGVSCALAVAAAIALMFPLRCLHPPSGAVALTAILGGPAVHKLGYSFVLVPVLVNSLLLALLAVAFNNLAKRRYPHNLPPSAHKAKATPSERVGVTRDDLHAVLAEQGEMLDISEDDLEDILIRAETRAHQRRFGELRCRDFMTNKVLTIGPDTPCLEAAALMRLHQFDVLPVVTPNEHLLGLVSLYQLLPDGSSANGAAMAGTVREVMVQHPLTTHLDTPIEQLVHPFADQGNQHAAVLDDDHRLVGIVTQADLIAALFREQLEMQAGA